MGGGTARDWDGAARSLARDVEKFSLSYTIHSSTIALIEQDFSILQDFFNTSSSPPWLPISWNCDWTIRQKFHDLDIDLMIRVFVQPHHCTHTFPRFLS